MRCVPLVLATLVAATAQAQADSPPSKPPRIAIVSSVAVSLDVALVDALSQDLAEALMVDLEVDAIGGLDVRRKLSPEGIPRDCVANAACVQDVATRLGADQLLFVAMVDIGNTTAIQIDSMWVDPASGQRASRPAIALASIEDAKPRFVANARRLLPDAPARDREPPRLAPQLTGTMSPAVPRHVTTPVVVASAGVLVGLGVGIGFGLTARARFRECTAAPCTHERARSVKTFSLVADLGHATWVLSAGLATYLYVTSGRESRLVFSPTSDGVAAGVVGRF